MIFVPIIARVGALAGTMLLACAAVAATVDEIAADPKAYAESDFSLSSLTAAVKAEVERSEAKPNFRELEVTLTAGSSISAPKMMGETSRYIRRITNLGNGAVRQYQVFARGEKPLGFNFEISYVGLFKLRWQDVAYPAQSPHQLIRQAISISRMSNEAANPKENSEYAFERRIEQGVGGVSLAPRAESTRRLREETITTTCVSGTSYPASTLHPDLPGNAIDFVCDESLPGEAERHRIATYAFLQHFGVAQLVANRQGEVRRQWKITRFRAD
jgi:hypothetical protein